MAKDIEDSELTGQEVEVFNGLAIINVEEIAYICENDTTCSVYMKSGDYLEVNVSLDVMASYIGCK